MNLREIKPEERPRCPQCDKPLVLTLAKSYYKEVCAWDFDCECVDTDRLKPDKTYKF